MSPDDPRHGTYAGYMAHRHSGQMPPCEACAIAHLRYTKRVKMRLTAGTRNRVPLGTDAWQRLTDIGNVRAAAATGLNANRLSIIQRTGPEAVVMRSTRAALLALRAPTPAGIQRRVRALIALGYSAQTIADAAGIHVTNLRILARRTDVPTLVRSDFAEAICAAYNALSHRRVGGDRWSTATRLRAQRDGWAPPLAWDDIDTDTAPRGLRVKEDGGIDPVVVQRILSGERLRANRAERQAVLAAWSGTQNQLERLTGWNVNREVRQMNSEAPEEEVA